MTSPTSPQLTVLSGRPSPCALRALWPLRRITQRLRSWIDRLAVSIHGGVRVRVLPLEARQQGRPRAYVLGSTRGLPPIEILEEVITLSPPGPGALDIRHDGHGTWSLRATGRLTDRAYIQRLRNALVNS